MKKSDSEIALLLNLLEEGYRKAAWHGPNLRGSIRGVDHREAAWRPGPNRHNIWEIVVHAAYWKYIVRGRILGEREGSFPIKGSNWFKRPDVVSEKAWRDDIALLERCHRQLIRSVAGLRAFDLPRKAAGSRQTNGYMIRGAAFHDVYHAGQIQLLKRMMK